MINIPKRDELARVLPPSRRRKHQGVVLGHGVFCGQQEGFQNGLGKCPSRLYRTDLDGGLGKSRRRLHVSRTDLGGGLGNHQDHGP